MADNGLTRTDYWNRVTGTVRTGNTGHGETVTDIEDFLLPYSQAVIAGLHSWGVADGLNVTATTNQATLSIAPGTAIDASGHVITLIAGGSAVTDPGIDPNDVANIVTVSVDTTGLSLSTANHSGTQYLTIRYLEVSDEGAASTAPKLHHAPWLRLHDSTGFSDTGVDVVLARVELANDGSVTALSAELRRLAALPAQRIQLRRPTATTAAGALSVAQTPAAELAARPDGGLDINALNASDPPHTALTVDPAGNIGVGTAQPQRRLHVEDSQIHSGGVQGGLSFADRASGSFVENPDAGQRWLWYAQNGTARLWSGGDRLSVSANGNIAVGLWAQQAQRTLHVEGSEVHSGGSGGGYSFADRASGSFVEKPDAGQRWVWYAQNGTARLWSGGDVISVNTSGGVSIVNGLLSVSNAKPAPNEPFSTAANAVTANSTNGTGVCAQSSNGTGLVATGKTALSTFGPSSLSGDVTISGALQVTGNKHCLIDHPLDPGNKTLTHACLESDERLNVYSGNVELDDNGEARVTLPQWVAALNKDFRYQLTCIGQAAPVYVAQEVDDDAFSIAGGAAGMRVSWQLTGVRNDAYAQANPVVVEQDKPEDEKGFFVNPEAFGHDHTRHVQYKRHEHLVRAYPRQAEHAIAAYIAGRSSRLSPG